VSIVAFRFQPHVRHCAFTYLCACRVNDRWLEWLKYLHIKLASLADILADQQVEWSDEQMHSYLLDFQAGALTKRYTVMRLCLSHYCKAVRDHGIHGKAFKNLPVKGAAAAAAAAAAAVAVAVAVAVAAAAAAAAAAAVA
jgi:hypothetical protein